MFSCTQHVFFKCTQIWHCFWAGTSLVEAWFKYVMMLCPLNVGLWIWLVVLTSEASIFKYPIYCLNTRICLNQKCSGFFLSHIKGHFHTCLYFPKGLRNWITFNKQQNLSKVLTLRFIYFWLNLETKSCRLCRGGAKYKKMQTDRLYKKLGNRLQLTAPNYYNRITVINCHRFLHTEKCS